MEPVLIRPYDSNKKIWIHENACVVTKYGNSLQVESYDPTTDEFTFTDIDPQTGKKYNFQSHRISYIINEKEYHRDKLYKELHVFYDEFDELRNKIGKTLEIRKESMFNRYDDFHQVTDEFEINFDSAQQTLSEMSVAFHTYQEALFVYKYKILELDEKYGPDVYDDEDQDY